MIRLPADGGTQKPLRRLVLGGEHGELVAELTERTVTLRPRGARRVEVVAEITWGALYQRAILANIETIRRTESNRARRGRRSR
jgi:hypothetical protein